MELAKQSLELSVRDDQTVDLSLTSGHSSSGTLSSFLSPADYSTPSEHNALLEENKRLKEQLNSVSEREEFSRQQVKQQAKTIRSLQREVHSLNNGKIERLREKLQEVSSDKVELENKVSSMAKKLLESESALVDAKLSSNESALQVQDLEAEVKRLNETVQSKVEIIDSLKASKEELKVVKAEAAGRLLAIKKLEEDNFRLTKSLEETELLAEQLQKRIYTLLTGEAGDEESCLAAETHSEQKEPQVELLFQQLAANEKEMDKILRENDRLIRTQDNMSFTIQKQMEIIQELEDELEADVDEQVSYLMEENDRLKIGLKNAKDIVIQLRLDLQQAQRASMDYCLQSIEEEPELLYADDERSA